MTPQEALDKAIAHAGSQAALGERLGVRQSVVSYWVTAGEVPEWRVKAIVDAVDGVIQPHQLRPDKFKTASIPHYGKVNDSDASEGSAT